MTPSQTAPMAWMREAAAEIIKAHETADPRSPLPLMTRAAVECGIAYIIANHMPPAPPAAEAEAVAAEHLARDLVDLVTEAALDAGWKPGPHSELIKDTKAEMEGAVLARLRSLPRAVLPSWPDDIEGALYDIIYPVCHASEAASSAADRIVTYLNSLLAAQRAEKEGK